GNICRSPMAEAVCRKKVKERNLEEAFSIDSAGVSGHTEGWDPDPRTQAIADKYALDVSEMQARPVRKENMETFDYVLVMDTENYEDVAQLIGQDHPNNLYLLRFFDSERDEAYPNIPDPYFDEQEGFEYTYRMIERSVEGFLNHVVEVHNI
ncbi:MAG: low molecular weight protein-tyrosine-phosphatase, partial [Candidatus Paceibacteria bacterium]